MQFLFRIKTMSRMNKNYNYIIIGACRAGLTAAVTLREIRPEASILVINGEDRMPYKRTDLTKNLASGFTREEFSLYEEGWYEENNIRLLSDKVVDIDPEAKILNTRDGQSLEWGSLLLATGAVPVTLSLPGCEWLFHLRTAADAEFIRGRLTGKKRVIILGQGVEGVELAEQCRLMGHHVTITGRDSRLMQRWLDEEQSRRLLALMESRGVQFSFNQHMEEVRKEENVIKLKSREETLTGDLILSSTGIVGNPDLAQAMGIYGRTGILINEFNETALPGIFAAGDAVQFPEGWPRGLWHWAEYQGSVAALNMGGIQTKLVHSPTRLKCEPFGEFYYSMSLQLAIDNDQSTVYRNDSELYLRIFSRQNRSIAALMTGLGKAESKVLDRGIKSGMPPEDLYKAVLKMVEKEK